MNLLLLLSALLSALTGVSAGVRAPTVTQAVRVSERVAPSATVAPATVARRPVAVVATLREAARRGPATTLLLGPIEPIFAARRRE